MVSNLEGLVLYEMTLRSFFHVVCCSCEISSFICLSYVCKRLVIPGVEEVVSRVFPCANFVFYVSI